ncbi:MAG: hypothetical protein K8R58_00100, partial [Bacteroidales bacterium]|nr:hypothetical protein [Bacteroidales bacterium]
MFTQAKKFGTFSGVFTPSILTILGVIMYMRLGWVVGEAGLIGTIGIIVIAHIISVSTGLSISSIATDKKIKTGGIYYILSRSLGLPMGGSIGITIFIGTALSISLYVIGFCENFLGIEAIRNFLGLGTSINDYRLIGTFIIILLVIIAFISTSLAIKAQFLILGAIALSLISIFTGFFLNPEFHPDTVSMSMQGGVSLEIVFAVFFPAVTGFTAGVAMSGDLKDPKRSIPVGTLVSILVGFVIYITLAIGLAYFVNRDLLLGDKNFLMKIAWFSPLVVAGIWGATLSSALGGILGGPRILQAISKDKITPKIFGKGFGESNEPRNALIFTFLLAEAGILIGELNVIARIVSMFYIAAYGFINLSYALESWASSDFRPGFRIPKWIGILGFLACFGVMFRIDTIAMFLSLIIMLGIYFILKKKELQLDLGDVWQSVWSSLIRTLLHKIDMKELEERNWRPSIILFSESTSARPYLIQFGEDLVGKHGFLSNFDLIENKTADILFSKHQQSLISEDSVKYKGVFTRKQSCKNFYEGVEMIARTYGFSGVEPNTVLLSWARQSENPVRFTKMVKMLTDLDLNVLMIDYDQKLGFGEKKTIDIWWQGGSNNGNLSLYLVKFIWLSENWRNANARLLIVNPVNEEKERIKREADNALDKLRIKADVKIINNQFEQKSFYEIIKIQSINSDLIFLGIPDIETGKEQEFVDKINYLCKNPGTVILIRASSYFKELQIAVKQDSVLKQTHIHKKIDMKITEKKDIAVVSYPKHSLIAKQLRILFDDLIAIVNEFQQNYFLNIINHNNNLIISIKEEINKNFSNLEKKCNSNQSLKSNSITKIKNTLLFRLRKEVAENQNKTFEIQQDILLQGIEHILIEIEKSINKSPKFLIKNLLLEDLKSVKEDKLSLKRFKFFKRIKIKITHKKNETSYKIKYQKLIKSYLPIKYYQSIFEILNKWGLTSFEYIIEFQKLIKSITDSFLLLETRAARNKLSIKTVIIEKEKTNLIINKIEQLNKNSLQSLYNFFLNETAGIVQQISNDLNHLNTNRYIKNKGSDSLNKKINNILKEIPYQWFKNQLLFNNSTLLEILLFSFCSKIRTISDNITKEIDRKIEKDALNNYHDLNSYLNKYIKTLEKEPLTEFNFLYNTNEQDNFIIFCQNIIDATFRKIKSAERIFPDTIDIMNEESLNNFIDVQFKGVELVHISVLRLADYLIQSEFIEPIQKNINKLADELQKSYTTIQDMVRYISFSTYKNDSDIYTNDNANIIVLLNEQTGKINTEIENVNELRMQALYFISERLHTLEDKLSLSSFIKSAANLKQYIKEQEVKSKLSLMKNVIKKSDNFFKYQVNQFWYRQSKGILLANRLKAADLSEHTSVNELLNLSNEVSINTKILDKLPFYYKQLFLRKQYFLNEFWVGRERELAGAEKTIDRYKMGFLGGIMVTGEYNSGKTFFSQFIANKYFNNPNIYVIHPPFAGSIDINDFKKSLENALEIKGSYKNIFNNIKQNSIIIIDDLELWWEKSQNGFDVIEDIIGLISEYSNKCLFIVNTNIHSYKLINKIRKIEDCFLNNIELEAFNAEQL